MKHNSPGAQRVQAPTLDQELAIRQMLPASVVNFAMQKLHASFGWWSLVELVENRGELGALEQLKRVNAMDHVNNYGPEFYRGLSPWRNY
ncbi:hypothetical protein [Mesorhizobium sp. WSM2239]|uniref:Uncharacterized protein n=2 Tax=unclassified Mesorhizobium TaxID=325217 RepID=A0AAU8DGR7_9HYPH